MKEYTNSDVERLISEYIHSDRDRQILRRRLIDGITYDNLAEEFNYLVRQIKRIVYRLQNVLFEHM